MGSSNSNQRGGKKPQPTTVSTSSVPKTQQTPSNNKPPPKTQSSSSSNLKGKDDKDTSVFSLARLEALFDQYKDEDNQIGPTEIERFCTDLKVDPEDVVMIVLAYHLKCKEMGVFSRDEFVKGFESMGCDTLDKIRAELTKLRKELDDSTRFQAIYRYAFQFAKEEEQKCLGLEIAQGLLGLLLVERYPIVKSFITFLKQQDQYKVVNADQWSSLLEFCKTIQPDFSNYDEDGAWPVIFDEWVTWAKTQKSA